MSSRRRITIALVGLIALVVAGWFTRAYADTSSPGPQGQGGRATPVHGYTAGVAPAAVVLLVIELRTNV